MGTSKSGKPGKVWLNGKLVDWKDATVHVLSHSLHYGTAIFEGIRSYSCSNGTCIFRLEDHLHRLADGMKIYHFNSCLSLDYMRKGIIDLVRANKLGTAYIRPIVYIATEKVGLEISDTCFSMAVIGIPFTQYHKNAATGLHCKVSTWRRIESSVLSPNVKASANYLNSVLASDEAKRDGYDEAILLNHSGKVAEASGENLFIVKNGVLITPQISDGILDGITRNTVIRLAHDLGYEVSERSILREELYTADEVFLTGSAAEIVPVISVDKVPIGNNLAGKAGKVTLSLRSEYLKLVSGKNRKYVDWLTKVKF